MEKFVEIRNHHIFDPDNPRVTRRGLFTNTAKKGFALAGLGALGWVTMLGTALYRDHEIEDIAGGIERKYPAFSPLDTTQTETLPERSNPTEARDIIAAQRAIQTVYTTSDRDLLATGGVGSVLEAGGTALLLKAVRGKDDIIVTCPEEKVLIQSHLRNPGQK